MLPASLHRPCAAAVLIARQTPFTFSLRTALLYNTWFGRFLLKLPVRRDSGRQQPTHEDCILMPNARLLHA
jgi:hypothetical protein